MAELSWRYLGLTDPEKCIKSGFFFLFLIRLNGPDPLRSLPNQQRVAMNNTCESIQWLLQDEVVSELRNTGPYTTATLDKVIILFHIVFSLSFFLSLFVILTYGPLVLRSN